MISRDPQLRTKPRTEQAAAKPRSSSKKIREGAPFQCGGWTGRVWKVWSGYVFAVQCIPGTDIMCNYKIHHTWDCQVTRSGTVLAIPKSDISTQRVARSWARADA